MDFLEFIALLAQEISVDVLENEKAEQETDSDMDSSDMYPQ